MSGVARDGCSEHNIILANGIALPRIGLGTFRAHGDKLKRVISYAIEHGITHIDTASVYQNESDIADAIEQGVWEPREAFFITSKIGPAQQGTERAQLACEEILGRLRTDHVDLLLIHWPGVAKLDTRSARNAAKRLETWRVLEDFYRSGRCRAIGVSNYQQRHLEELLAAAEIKPMVNQIEVHPRYQQTSLRGFCVQHGIAVVAYASLGCGSLLGHETVLRLSHRLGRTPAQVLLRWALQHGCGVIPKTVHVHRLDEYRPEALLTWSLSDADMAALNALDDPDKGKVCWNPEDIR